MGGCLIQENSFIFPAEALSILDRLEAHGFQAYIVGGAVRDSLLAIPTHDVDITTDAKPDQIQQLFSDYRTVDVGRSFGTIRVIIGHTSYEVTTFRSERGYSDGRHPDQVTFSHRLEDDLKRRDFTMNAMAWSAGGGLVDIFGGQEDLKAGVLRAVGRPEERIGEDALRMLRAVRFASRFSLTMEEELYRSIQRSAPAIRQVSRERILDELSRMLVSEQPSLAVFYLQQTGLLHEILPAMDGTAVFFSFLDKLPASLPCRWAGLFRNQEEDLDSLSALSSRLLKGLTASNELRRRSSRLLREPAGPLPESLPQARYYCQRLGEEAEDVLTFLQVENAALRGGGWQPPLLAMAGQEEEGRARALDLFKQRTGGKTLAAFRQELERSRFFLQRIREEGLAVTVQDLAISGNDLIQLGCPRGPELGRLLNHLLDQLIQEKLVNEKEALKEAACCYLQGCRPAGPNV